MRSPGSRGSVVVLWPMIPSGGARLRSEATPPLRFCLLGSVPPRHPGMRRCSGPALGRLEEFESLHATRCWPMWCRPRCMAGRTGLSGRWTTSGPSWGRCWPSGSSASLAFAGRSRYRSSPGSSPPWPSSTPSATPLRPPFASTGPSGSGSGPCCVDAWGRLMGGIAALGDGNGAATLRILRATELLDPGRSDDHATQLALGLYVVYNLAATLISVPAGHYGDRPSQHYSGAHRRRSVVRWRLSVVRSRTRWCGRPRPRPLCLQAWGSAAPRQPSTPPWRSLPPGTRGPGVEIQSGACHESRMRALAAWLVVPWPVHGSVNAHSPSTLCRSVRADAVARTAEHLRALVAWFS
jgi:hypothetical protein